MMLSIVVKLQIYHAAFNTQSSHLRVTISYYKCSIKSGQTISNNFGAEPLRHTNVYRNITIMSHESCLYHWFDFYYNWKADQIPSNIMWEKYIHNFSRHGNIWMESEHFSESAKQFTKILIMRINKIHCSYWASKTKSNMADIGRNLSML